MTLSLMDELGFTTTFSTQEPCSKCTKLDTENSELKTILTTMRVQADKTGEVLKKFNAVMKVSQSQKQKIEMLERRDQQRLSELQVVKTQLKRALDNPSELDKTHKKKLTDLQSEVTTQKDIAAHHLRQLETLQTQIENLTEENKALGAEKRKLALQVKRNAEKTASDKAAERAAIKAAPKTDQEKLVSELKAEVAKLKKDNTRLSNLNESKINDLADRKNKDITERLASMERMMESMMKSMKDNAAAAVGSLPPGRAPARAPLSDSPRISAKGKRIGRPPKRRLPSRESEDSDLELPLPQKSFKRPTTARSLASKATLSGDDSDSDLAGELESLVCDPLPPSPAKPVQSKRLRGRPPLPTTTLPTKPTSTATLPTKVTATAGAQSSSFTFPQKPDEKVPTRAIFDLFASRPIIPPLALPRRAPASVGESSAVSESSILAREPVLQKPEPTPVVLPEPLVKPVIEPEPAPQPVPVVKPVVITKPTPDISPTKQEILAEDPVTPTKPGPIFHRAEPVLLSPLTPTKLEPVTIATESSSPVKPEQPPLGDPITPSKQEPTPPIISSPHFNPITIKNENKRVKSDPAQRVLTLKPFCLSPRGDEGTAAPLVVKVEGTLPEEVLALETPSTSGQETSEEGSPAQHHKTSLPATESLESLGTVGDTTVITVDDESTEPATTDVIAILDTVKTETTDDIIDVDRPSAPESPAVAAQPAPETPVLNSTPEKSLSTPATPAPLSPPTSPTPPTPAPLSTLTTPTPAPLSTPATTAPLSTPVTPEVLSESEIQCAFELDVVSTGRRLKRLQKMLDCSEEMDKAFTAPLTRTLRRRTISLKSGSESEGGSQPKLDCSEEMDKAFTAPMTRTLRRRTISLKSGSESEGGSQPKRRRGRKASEGVEVRKETPAEARKETPMDAVPLVPVTCPSDIVTELTTSTADSELDPTLPETKSTPPKLDLTLPKKTDPTPAAKDPTPAVEEVVDPNPEVDESLSIVTDPPDESLLIVTEDDPAPAEKEEVGPPARSLPPAAMFAPSLLNLDLAPSAPTTTESTPPATASRKRKKSTPPVVESIFDLFLPLPVMPSIAIPPAIPPPSSSPSISIPPPSSPAPEPTPTTTSLPPLNSITLQPSVVETPEGLKFYPGYEDYSAVTDDKKVIRFVIEMFRRNLCTSAPDTPYLVKTMVHNISNSNIVQPDRKMVAAIRNEIVVRNALDPQQTPPPISVLVSLFHSVLSQISAEVPGYGESVLRQLFIRLAIGEKNFMGRVNALFQFSVQLSACMSSYTHLRGYVVRLILGRTARNAPQIVAQLNDCVSTEALLGAPRIPSSSYESGELWLVGLEFFLRYGRVRFGPAEKWRFAHQYTVEHKVLKAAVAALATKAEEGTVNDQALLCLRLMARSQSWSWVVGTLLPEIFNCLESATEYGVCRLLESMEHIVTAEVTEKRADVELIRAKVIPCYTDIASSAPSFDVKRSAVKCLVNLYPVSPDPIKTALEGWLQWTRDNYELHQASELDNRGLPELKSCVAKLVAS